MNRSAVTSHTRQLKMNPSREMLQMGRPSTSSAPTPCSAPDSPYDTAFLADRGCFTQFNPRLQPASMRMTQRKQA
jgi:hypothetical protein